MSTRTAFRSLARIEIPEINDTNALSDADFNSILDVAQRELIKEIEGYPTSKTFDVTASAASYNLHTVVSDFMRIHKAGLWYKSSSTANWRQLDPITLAELSRRFPGWKNASSGTISRYYIEGNLLGVNPPASTAVTSGFEMYYYAQSTDISDNANYLFNNSASIELKFLLPYEDILMDFFRSKAAEMLGKKQDALLYMDKFYKRAAVAKGELLYREDILQDHQYKPSNIGWAMKKHRSAYQS